MLEDFTVSKLGRVNLIVGKNNSGKSTVLEALRIYAGNGNEKLLKSIAENRNEEIHIGKLEYKHNEEIRIGEQYYYAELYPYEKVPNIIKIGEEGQSPSKLFDFKQPFWVYPHKSEIQKRAEVSFVPTNFIPIDELESEWNGINLTDNEEIVIQALQIIIPDFKRLAFDGNKNKRWVKVKLANLPKPVPLKSLGDGMLRVLQIAIKLVSAQGGFLLIDEFENGLHYSVQEKIWALLFEMAEKLDIQVFATTHSWDCIESFSKVAFENETTEGVLFRMGRSAKTSNKGQVIATVYDKERLYNITQADIEVR
jgi:AAA15 family ATPase/GTPase